MGRVTGSTRFNQRVSQTRGPAGAIRAGHSIRQRDLCSLRRVVRLWCREAEVAAGLAVTSSDECSEQNDGHVV